MNDKEIIKRIFYKAQKWWLYSVGILILLIFIPVVNLFILLGPGDYLEKIENVFGFMNLTTRTGGWFSFTVPNLFGFLFIGIILLLGCLCFAFIRANKKHLTPTFYFVFVCLFSTTVTFLLYVPMVDNMRYSPKKCALVFDGKHQPNKSECYYYSASLNKKDIDLDYCDSNINQSYYRSKKFYARCLVLLAKQNDDIKYCNKIIDSSEENSLARNLSNIKKTCYSEISISQNTSCVNIDLRDSRDQCHRTKAISELNLSTCKLLSTRQAIENCYFEIIKINKDTQSCSKIRTAELTKRCQDSALYEDELIFFPIPVGVTYSGFEAQEKDEATCSKHIQLQGHGDFDFWGKIEICKSLHAPSDSLSESTSKIGLESIDYQIQTKTYHESNIERDYSFSNENTQITLFYKGVEDSPGQAVFEKILRNITFISE